MILSEYLNEEHSWSTTWYRLCRRVPTWLQQLDIVVPLIYMLLSITMSLPGVAMRYWMGSYLMMSPASVQAVYGFMMAPYVRAADAGAVALATSSLNQSINQSINERLTRHHHQLLKPVYGLVSDVFPIFGYRRFPYILLASLLVFASWLLPGIFGIVTLHKLAQRGLHWSNPSDGGMTVTCVDAGDCDSSTSMFVVMLVVLSLFQCVEGVVVDSWVVERVRVKETLDKDTGKLQTVCTILRIIGTLLASFLSGYLLESLTPPVVFVVTSLCPLLVAFLSCFIDETVFVYKLPASRDTNAAAGDVNASVSRFETPDVDVELASSSCSSSSSALPLLQLHKEDYCSSSDATPPTAHVVDEREAPSDAELQKEVPATASCSLAQMRHSLALLKYRWSVVRPQLSRAWFTMTRGGLWKLALFLLLIYSSPNSFSAFFYYLTNELHFSSTTIGVVSVVATFSSLLGTLCDFESQLLQRQ